MQKVIHRSWRDLGEPAERDGATLVALEFEGYFTEGSFEGTLFSGHITYDRAAHPSERHINYAVYEDWSRPVVTMAIGGHIVSGAGAAVYAGVYDGRSGHRDFVNLFGTCAFRGGEDNAQFELFFADEGKAVIDATAMPTAAQLRRFRDKTVMFATNAPGNVISRGAFTLIAERRSPS